MRGMHPVRGEGSARGARVLHITIKIVETNVKDFVSVVVVQ